MRAPAASAAPTASDYLRDMALVPASKVTASIGVTDAATRGRWMPGPARRRRRRSDELAAGALQRVVDGALPHPEFAGALAVGAVVGRQREGTALELAERAGGVEDAAQPFAAERLGDGIVIGTP